MNTGIYCDAIATKARGAWLPFVGSSATAIGDSLRSNLRERLKLSFIIPTHNRAHCIGAAIRSVLTQSCSDEILVVDDHSTDGTAGLLQRDFSDSPVFTVRPPQRSGATGAKNCGVKHASGDVFVFLDSDDEMLPGGVEHIREAFHTRPSLDVHFGPVVSKATGQVSTTTLPRQRPVRFDEYLTARSIGEFLPSCRSYLFRGPGYRFPEDVNGFEGILWGSLVRAGYSAWYDVHPVRLYDDVSDDRMCSPGRLARESLRLALGYEAYLNAFGADLLRLHPEGYRSTALKYAAYAASTGYDATSPFRRNGLPMPVLARALGHAPRSVITLGNQLRLGLRSARAGKRAARAAVANLLVPATTLPEVAA
jgi:glycosyltransferase involved in cell wall biosynthesis